MSLKRSQFTPLHTSTLPDFDVGSIENEFSKNEHWVARLFQPTYREDLAENSQELKTVLGDRLTAIDPEALKKVFHRVHALLTEQREIVESPTERPKREERQPEQTEKSEVSTDDSCIWDESEISVLRRAFKATRDENRKLKSHLTFAEQRLASLDSKYTKLRKDNDQKIKLLNDATQANKRLQILAESLKRDADSALSENASLEEQVQALKLERLDLIEKLKNSRIESDHDRIEKKRLELEMRENGRTLLETAAHLEAKLRVKYEEEVNELNMRIADLEEELADEKKIHTATKRGLDHLRNHFASLPMDTVPPKDGMSKLALF